MDQLRKLMAWLKQYHFWVLSVVIVVVAFGCWFTSASALTKQFKEHQGKIESTFKDAEKVRSAQFHPNQEMIDKQTVEIQKRGATIMAAWQKLYDLQRATVLKWPENALGKRFCDEMDKLKFGEPIPDDLRRIYRDYVELHFPTMPKRIQAQLIEGSTSGRSAYSSGGGATRERVQTRDSGMMQQGVAEPPQEEFICQWLDQQSVRDQLHFETAPSSLKMWVTQENLWAYTTLLDVVAATNQSVKADRQSNAAVRVIQTLEVGQPAAAESRTGDRITLADAARVPVAAAAGAGGEAPVAAGQGRTESREASGQAETPEQEAITLLAGRYVDGDGKPIGFTGDVATIRTAFGKEYKRLPVRLVIQMDWNSLSYLIAQCANQPLQVEVQEVRINPADGGAGSSGFGNRSRDSGTMQGFGTAGGAQVFPANENLVKVVIQGVIYIFNEPDKSIVPATDGAAANGVAAN